MSLLKRKGRLKVAAEAIMTDNSPPHLPKSVKNDHCRQSTTLQRSYRFSQTSGQSQPSRRIVQTT